jgi:hypothetical protein
MEIQSITFEKKYYDLEKSTLWMIENRLPIDYPTITKNWIIFKTKEPSLFKANSFITKKIKGFNIYITFAEKLLKKSLTSCEII